MLRSFASLKERLDGWQYLSLVVWALLVAPAVGFLVLGIGETYNLPLSDEQVKLIQASGWSPGFYKAVFAGIFAQFTLICIVLGALILWRQPRAWMARFLAVTLLVTSIGLVPIGDFAVHAHPELGWLLAIFRILSDFCFAYLFFVFPNGRFVPRWSIIPATLWAVIHIPGRFFPTSAVDVQLVPLLENGGWAALLLLMVGAQVYRFRRVSTSVEREQTKWVMFGTLIALGMFALFTISIIIWPTYQDDNPVLGLAAVATTTLAMTCLPLSIAIAILRYRLYNIDQLINRTLVYLALTACVIGLYVGVVMYLGALFRTGHTMLTSLVATGIVAVAFQPLRAKLQQGINRLLYGQRDEPYAVLASLDQRLAGSLAPEAVLPTIVETVATTLKLPHVAIALYQENTLVTAAAHGAPRETALQLPLVYQHEQVGELRLAARSPGETFGASDMRLLHDIARHAGVVAHAVQLTAELQHARVRLVNAREEERRRLRRDLHDGLGPQLAGLTLLIGAARKIQHDPAALEPVFDQLAAQTKAAIGDVRRVINDLRPPALDDMGLITALREHTAMIGQHAIQITLNAPEKLPPMPAAVEVAAYRIVMEAVHNVVKHAQARHCTITLAAENGLIVGVRDDGRGLPAMIRPGVGLHSLQERAEELGGTCVIESLAEGGTRVHAIIPLPGGTQ